MVEEPEQEPTDPEPPDGRLRKWIDRLTDVEKLFVQISGVLAALVLVVGGAVTLGKTALGGDATAKSSAEASPDDAPDGSPSAAPIAPSTPAPTVTPPAAPPPALIISVTCRIPGNLKPGQRTKATYSLTSNQSVNVGLGLGIYDSNATDHSNGDGDMDGFRLSAGNQSVTRDVLLPTDLDAGKYEIDAEIWPTGKIGADGVEVLAEAPCGYLNVP